MNQVTSDRVNSRNDQSSLSNPSMAISTSIHLDWSLDFSGKVIRGTCLHTITVLVTDTETVDFDSSNLNIESVSVNDTSVPFRIAEKDPQLGSKISVSIPKLLRASGTTFDVLFKYCTGKDASAMQWLDPSATKGGKHPYVFTQSQAIHARSMLPCMDSPGVKTTYTATVKAPEWCTVLMSALADDAAGQAKGVCKWRQPVPTSAYLIALAAGNLDFRDISRRVRIWAEPEVVDAAASDFSETEEFLQAAEALTCPYAWTRYDVLCMPPSFPYGGMENPCLTFVTPTLLSGDKSLADVIAHEIAHSWTGNLVTNSTWEHFWLNEGWTVWLERKIIASVKGTQNAKLSAQIGWKHLKDDVALMGADSGFTSLVWPLGGEDPDDAFSSVPYEKGFNLLYYLENLMGSGPFGDFAKAYIQRFMYKTVTSGDFRDFFIEFFTTTWDPLSPSPSMHNLEAACIHDQADRDTSTKFVTEPATPEASVGVVQYLTDLLAAPLTPSKDSRDRDEGARQRQDAVAKVAGINWSELLHCKGMPADPVPGFENSLSEAAEALAERWIALEGKSQSPPVGSEKDLEGWSTQQVNIFLEYLLTHAAEVAPLSEGLLLSLNSSYKFTNSGNSEIRFRWQSLCLQSDVAWIVPEVVAFITSQGRMKYVRPLYRAMLHSKTGRQAAFDTFKKFKNTYHPIARKMVEADLTKDSTGTELENGTEAEAEVKAEKTPVSSRERSSPSKSFSVSTSTAIIVFAVASIIGITIFAKNRIK